MRRMPQRHRQQGSPGDGHAQGGQVNRRQQGEPSRAKRPIFIKMKLLPHTNPSSKGPGRVPNDGGEVALVAMERWLRPKLGLNYHKLESEPLVHRYICCMMIWHKITGFIGAALLAYGSLMLGGVRSRIRMLSPKVRAGTTETSTAKLEISGMMCAHACGGKIKKELLEILGVANASIDFESGRDLNAAEVEFDPKSVTPESLADVVNGIADGKLYAVASVQVTHFAKEASLHSRLSRCGG